MSYREHKLSLKFPGLKALLAKTFPGYRGRKITVETAKTISFYDINWDGGTRTVYVLVNTETGETKKVANHEAPWSNYAADARGDHAIPQNAIIVSHGIFCGKDIGIRIVLPEQANTDTLALLGTTLANVGTARALNP